MSRRKPLAKLWPPAGAVTPAVATAAAAPITADPPVKPPARPRPTLRIIFIDGLSGLSGLRSEDKYV